MNEYYCPVFAEHDIWTTWKTPVIHPKSKPMSV